MLSDSDAQATIKNAWKDVTGQEPSVAELQFVGAIGMNEGRYGSAWNNANNWGAIHCNTHESHGEPIGTVLGNGHCVVAQESKDGNVKKTGYLQPMRIYASPAEGAGALIRLLTVKRPKVWEAMKAGDGRGAVYAMHDSSYFTLDPAVYVPVVAKAAKQIADNVYAGKLALTFDGKTGARKDGTPGAAGTAGMLAILGLLGYAVVRSFTRK